MMLPRWKRWGASLAWGLTGAATLFAAGVAFAQKPGEELGGVETWGMRFSLDLTDFLALLAGLGSLITAAYYFGSLTRTVAADKEWNRERHDAHDKQFLTVWAELKDTNKMILAVLRRAPACPLSRAEESDEPPNGHRR